MKAFISIQTDPGEPNRTRRNLLTAFTFSLPLAWLAGGSLTARSAYADVPAAVDSAPSGFMPVSRLLTGHADIDDALANPAWHALRTRTEDFDTRFASLSKAVNDAGLTSLQDYPTSSIARDPDLKKTAVDIVSVWYLGRVGAIEARDVNGPTPVTYTGALMWRPTLDVTVIPSYSRGQPGFWGEKPPSTDSD